MKKFLMTILLITVFQISSIQSAVADSKTVTVKELINELALVADSLEDSPVMRAEFLALQKSHAIAADAKTYRDFIRVRLAFEATRDSGLWQIRWAVTDREPQSDAIWQQWKKQTTPALVNEESEEGDEESAKATATAECDELSALFAFVARKLGVKQIGLFWPTYNHTVAVWMPRSKNKKTVRVVVPTSQIFLSRDATLGTKEFDPSKQKTIYEYSRRDVSTDYKIPAPLAAMMIKQVKKFAGKPAEFLQLRRNRLSQIIDGS